MQQYDGLRMYPLMAVVGAQTVGHILLRHPTDDKSVVRFGFVIVDDTQRGKGYGKQMLRLAVRKARDELGAKRITLGVFDNNPIALRCYEVVGFKVIGADTYVIDGEEWAGREMELIISK